MLIHFFVPVILGRVWQMFSKCINCLSKGEKWDVRPQDCSLTFAWVLPKGGVWTVIFDIVVSFSLNSNCCLLSLLLLSSRISRFSNVYHLSIHISKNFGADTTKVFYIGLRGEWTEVRWGWKYYWLPPVCVHMCVYICMLWKWELKGKDKAGETLTAPSPS